MPDLVLTYTAGQVNRIQTALGRYQSLKDGGGAPRDATAAEIKAWLNRQVTGMVRTQERAAAEAAVTLSPDVEAT
jgi:hypothetical protein